MSEPTTRKRKKMPQINVMDTQEKIADTGAYIGIAFAIIMVFFFLISFGELLVIIMAFVATFIGVVMRFLYEQKKEQKTLFTRIILYIDQIMLTAGAFLFAYYLFAFQLFPEQLGFDKGAYTIGSGYSTELPWGYTATSTEILLSVWALGIVFTGSGAIAMWTGNFQRYMKFGVVTVIIGVILLFVATYLTVTALQTTPVIVT